MKLYKNLLRANLASFIILMSFPAIWARVYSQDIVDALNLNGKGGVFDLNGPVPLIIAVTYFVSIVGLFNLKAWARHVYLALLIAIGVVTPFFGISVQGYYEGIFGYFFGISCGAILTLSYFSSISNQFK